MKAPTFVPIGATQPRYLPNFDSAGAMISALANYLQGRDFPGVVADQRRARNVVVAVEATTIVHGLLSDHELALSRKLPMPLHLKLDIVAGALMASSPWLLGFAQRVWLPHLAIELGAIGAGLLTETEPRD